MSKTAEKKKRSAETPVAEPVKTGAVVLASKPAESKTSALSTSEPDIRIDSDVTRRIRQHARAHLKTEVCGVLIGESTDDTIEIRHSIEALNAAQAGTHVTFTQDAWEEIYKVKDDLYPEARIVGWYHSHPGFGIFLSEHDLFIQENFFSSPGQVAWVYDPHSDDEGCFGWVAGKVARLTSISTLYQSGDPVEHATKGQDLDAERGDEEDEDESPSRSSRSSDVPLWVVISRNVLTHLTVLLVGFAIAFYLLHRPAARLVALWPDPASGAVMVVDYQELRSYLEGKGAPPQPLDVIELPGAVQGQTMPSGPPTLSATPSAIPSHSPSSAPSTAPSTIPPASSASAPSAAPPPAKAPTPATTPTPTQPASPQPTKPQSTKPGSPK